MQRKRKPRPSSEQSPSGGAPGQCHCLIYHPQTPDERQQVRDKLAYARRIGDYVGIQLALAQLAGPCPAWEHK